MFVCVSCISTYGKVYVCIYVYVKRSYALLDVKASNSPQRVVHDVCSVQSLPPTLVRRFSAMGGGLPETAVAVEERFRPRIQAVGCPQDLCLH